jgi:exopolysaccharide biosynthesis WecB/TagA/CpsF family protein
MRARPSNEVADPTPYRHGSPRVQPDSPPKPAEISVAILGIGIATLTRGEALKRVETLVEAADPALLAFANAHTLNVAAENARFRAVLAAASLVLNDGIGVQLAARLRGTPFPENLNGTDFVPQLLRLAAARRWRVFFLGGRPGVAAAAAAAVTQATPGLEICGTRDGFFEASESSAVAEQIRASRCDIVLAGMGNPRQELWLDEWLAATGARLGVGVGAFFDFGAGAVRRAPRWMNHAGLEWLFRLAQEPRRLARRYVVGIPVFLVRAVREARTLRR